MKAHRFFVLLLCAFAIFAAVSCSDSTPTPEDVTTGDGGEGNSSANGLISPRALSGFRAEIVDATALGIQNSPVGSSKRLATARNAESMNYLVKTTTEYSPNEPGYDVSGLTSVTFTQITTENVTTELAGTKRLVATGSKDYPHDGTIAFMATDGFTYNVYDDSGSLKYENIIDNDSNDLDKQTGVIRIGNLTKGSKYIVEYKGTGEEISITQDDIDGEIDKLYVLNNYTFISFVPRGTSSRPSGEGLQYDSDGIAFYDKTDYYTASDRISFIIDNDTGYIYIIEDFHIKEIQGGCLLSNDDNFIYDFKINEKNELEIYSLFSNSDITWFHVFKDKFGYTYIQNDRITTYDETTKTQFYKFIGLHNLSSDALVDYLQTSSGEAIQITYDPNNWATLDSVKVCTESHGLRDLNSSDNFSVYYLDYDGWAQLYPFKVENGLLYSYMFSHDESYTYEISMMLFNPRDTVHSGARIYVNDVTDQFLFSAKELEDHDIVFAYSLKDETLYYIKDAWSWYDQIMGDYNYPGLKNISTIDRDQLVVALGNCQISDDNKSFLTYGIHGNTYYDVVIERDSEGSPIVRTYITGTYEEPQIKIILQPINR